MFSEDNPPADDADSSGSPGDPLSDDVFLRFSLSEMFWKDRHGLLQSRGYMLRPRYRPDWIPSWRIDPSMNILDAEDRMGLMVRKMCYHAISLSLLTDRNRSAWSLASHRRHKDLRW